MAKRTREEQHRQFRRWQTRHRYTLDRIGVFCLWGLAPLVGLAFRPLYEAGQLVLWIILALFMLGAWVAHALTW